MKSIIALILIPFFSFVKQIEISKETTRAEFPGGNSEMLKFIGQNLKVPKEFQDAGISGKIIISFCVKKEGTIDNIEILRSPGFGIDEEIIKVFKSMPKWIPAKLNGVPIDSIEKIPIACLKLE